MANRYSEDRRHHLELLQAVISRMAASSAVAKGWALTIAIATYGYAGTKPSKVVAILGIFAVLMFAVVDARYLREEKKFRLLFDGARNDTADMYEMNATRYCVALPDADRKSIRWRRVVWSWSVRDYYGVLALAGVALLIWLNCRP